MNVITLLIKLLIKYKISITLLCMITNYDLKVKIKQNKINFKLSIQHTLFLFINVFRNELIQCLAQLNDFMLKFP